MSTDLQDTIVALSSAPGAGRRAIVRLSGPQALDIVLKSFSTDRIVERSRRAAYAGQLHPTETVATLPAELLFWPAPKTYTGQDMAELHTISSPPLVELLVAQLIGSGGRAARPGEFTLRAFLAGKLDLTRAEAVLAVIDARSRGELQRALGQLAGGIAGPLQELRGELLDLLADVEAGLDFADEDIQFVGQAQLLDRVARALARLTVLLQQLDRRGLERTTFRAVLVGRPNAGKSSLFNALAGLPLALVSPRAGTTRDYLTRRIILQDLEVELIDTAGWQLPDDAIVRQAGELGRQERERADLVLLCVESGRFLDAAEQELGRSRDPECIVVGTKCDLARPETPFLATSAATGEGIGELKAAIAQRARARQLPALAPSLSRCRGHVEACLRHLRRAHATVLEEDPPELVALSLRETLEELGAMAGAVYTDDLLDRIFSRFCIGK